MHFNYRDDAKHYLQKNLEYQIDFLNDCRKLQRIKFEDDTSSICLCKHVSISFHLLTKYQGAQANQLKSIFSTSYQKKIKKFENRIKLYSSYFEDGVKLFKYIFPKAMKIPFLSSIFIIILASSCDVLCH